MEEPHTPRAQYDRRAVPVDVGTMDSSEHASGGLHEHRHFVGEVVWKTPRREFRCPMSNQDVVSEATGLQEVFPEHVTHGFIAATAKKTFTTGNVVRDDHAVAVTKLGDTVADGDNLAYQFVAKYRTGRGVAGVEFEQIGTTKTNDSQTQEHLADTWERNGPSFNCSLIATKTGDDEMVAFHAWIAVRLFGDILLDHGSCFAGQSQEAPSPRAAY